MTTILTTGQYCGTSRLSGSGSIVEGMGVNSSGNTHSIVTTSVGYTGNHC